MILSELIRQFRVLAFDKEQPYLFSDEDIADWLNDGVKEAAIRGRLIHESSNPDVCSVGVTAQQSAYPSHESIYEITSIRWLGNTESESKKLSLVSPEEIEDIYRGWQDKWAHRPEYVIQYDTYLRIVPSPLDAGTLHIEGYRTPLAPMTLDTDRPEINIIHHEYLIQWALHKGFGIPDSEVFDMNRSALAEQEFTRYFGERPDSDLRRITRHDVPHVVTPFWV